MRAMLLCGIAGVLAISCAEDKTQVKPAPAATQEEYKEPEPPPAGSPAVLLFDLEGEGVEAASGYTLYAKRGILETRRAFVALKSEQELLLASCDTLACQEKIRQHLSAPYLMTGAVGKIGETYVVRLKLLKPSSGEVLGRESRQGGSNIEGLVVDCAKALAMSIPAQ